jgi:hypothetical protein
MVPQLENYVMSSFLLYLTNKVQSKGQAFYNYSGKIYPISPIYNGITTYSAPIAPLVYDTSIVGATICTGVFINGNPTNIGQGNLTGIDYQKAQFHFTSPPNGTVTINSSISELNIVTPKIPHIQVLFDTKLEPIRDVMNSVITSGLQNNQLTFPAIYVVRQGGTEKPHYLGGIRESNTSINCMIFADSLFQADCLAGILKSSKYDYIPLIGDNDIPFNNMGGFRNNIPFNYTGLLPRISQGSGILIKSVVLTDFSRRIYSQIQNLPPNCYFSIAEFDIFIDKVNT